MVALAIMFLFSLSFLGCGAGGSDGDNQITDNGVEMQVRQGTIGNLFFRGINLTADTPFTTINGVRKKYKGGAYLIGSCDTTDNNDNITTRIFDGFHALGVGVSETWTGTMRTIDGSGSCLGPDYSWTITNVDGFHFDSFVHIYNVKTPIVALSLPWDFSKDPTDEFKFSRPSYSMTTKGCSRETFRDTGRLFESIPSECLTPGADVRQGLAIKGTPSPFFELRRPSLGIGFRRTILEGSNYRTYMAINHPGDHTLQASWDRGDENRPLMSGEELFGNEEWEVFYLNG